MALECFVVPARRRSAEPVVDSGASKQEEVMTYEQHIANLRRAVWEALGAGVSADEVEATVRDAIEDAG